MTNEVREKQKIYLFRAKSTAWPTVLLFLLFFLGVPVTYFFTVSGVITPLVGFFLGIVLYNCAFTIWHDAAHNNIFKKQWMNNLIGVLTSIVNIVVPFFRSRHDHLLHHRHLLDIEYDRTVYRARGAIWRLPISILEEMLSYKGYDKVYGLKTPWQKNVDRASSAIVVLLILWVYITGHFSIFLCCCLLPRLVIFPIHATYVCYLPHVGLPQNDSMGTRTLNVGFLKYFIFFHNHHAIHHLWPNIPWYLYERYSRLNYPVMKEKGVELMIKPWDAPIFGKKSWATGSLTEN